jgi:2'-5' RNA ligase
MIQRDLREAPIALSPPESLHQTMPGATTREQLTESDVRNIRSSIRKALDGFSSFVLFADRVKSFPEGSEILLKPSQNLNDLHRLLHTAISEGWGKPADGSPGKVLPHITIGYCNGVGDASLLYAVEEKYQKMKVSAPVNHVDLIWLRRESDRYAWDIIERFPLRQIG